MTAGLPNRKERTKAAIAAAAETLFLSRGFDGVSMDEISELAGITKQTVYSHVGSKEALFLAMVDRMTGGAGDALAESVPTPTDTTAPEDFLLAFAIEQLQIVVTPRLMQLRRLVIGEVSRFPDLGALLHTRGPTRSIEKLAAAIARYDREGTLAVDNADSAAAVFNWLVMGKPVNDAMLLGDAGIPDSQAKLAHAKECVRIFLSAFRPVGTAVRDQSDWTGQGDKTFPSG